MPSESAPKSKAKFFNLTRCVIWFCSLSQNHSFVIRRRKLFQVHSCLRYKPLDEKVGAVPILRGAGAPKAAGHAHGRLRCHRQTSCVGGDLFVAVIRGPMTYECRVADRGDGTYQITVYGQLPKQPPAPAVTWEVDDAPGRLSADK